MVGAYCCQLLGYSLVHILRGLLSLQRQDQRRGDVALVARAVDLCTTCRCDCTAALQESQSSLAHRWLFVGSTLL